MYALSARLLALSALFLSAVASPIADAQTNPPQPDHPPWDQVYIKSVNYAGTGCPAGSVAGTLASDGSFINVAFDKYTAQIKGTTSNPGDTRKNCQLTFVLQYPPGWSVTVFDASYYGYVKLDKKVTATQQSTYRWGGQSPTASFYSTWTGAVDKDYTFTDSLVTAAYVWSSCKGVPGSLIVNTSIKVENSKNPNGNGLITTDAIEGVVTHKYGCQWKRC